MYVIINTQFRENYGAHDWDGNGECPQHWKYKGGNTYIVTTDLWTQDAEREVLRLIQYASDYEQEYLLQVTLVDHRTFKLSDFCEEWERPVYLQKYNDQWVGRRTYKPEFPHHYPDINWHMEEWTALPCGEREDYAHSLSLTDGSVISYRDYLQKAS